MSIISDALKKLSAHAPVLGKAASSPSKTPSAHKPPSNQDKIAISLAAFVCVIAVIFILKSITPARQAPKTPKPSPVALVKKEPVPLPAAPAEENTPKEEISREEAPQEETLHEAPQINLSGIILDQEGKNMAIIDGRILGEGDAIGAIKILKIDARKVRIQYENREYEVMLE
jgi:hypothetical protein